MQIICNKFQTLKENSRVMSHGRLYRWIVAAAALALALGACAPAAQPSRPAPTASGDLVIYSGRSEALIKPVIEQFKAKYPDVNVVLKAGSNSELANALLEEKAAPQADLFLTTELMTVQKMANEDVFQAYTPKDADKLPADYHHPNWLWTGLTLRARVIMYNTDLVAADEAPKSILDLTDPKWKGQIAAAGSTNGGFQAHVAALRQILGDAQAEAWLSGLKANDVTFFGGHTDVRKAVGAGEFKIGLVNHYYYHLQKAEGSPVAVVYPDQADGQMGVVVNATAIGVVKGAQHPEAAGVFIDYLLSPEGQKLFAELNYEYPVIEGVALAADVKPLTDVRLATFDVVKAADSLNSTLTLVERVGVP
jgi:iron(III) transport system substrate-binding protein